MTSGYQEDTVTYTYTESGYMKCSYIYKLYKLLTVYPREYRTILREALSIADFKAIKDCGKFICSI